MHLQEGRYAVYQVLIMGLLIEPLAALYQHSQHVECKCFKGQVVLRVLFGGCEHVCGDDGNQIRKQDIGGEHLLGEGQHILNLAQH